MSKDNQNLKLRRIQADYQLFKLKSAIALLLGNKALSPGSFLDKTGHPLPTQIICEATPTTQRGCPVLSGDNVTRDDWQVLNGKTLLPRQQQVKARIVTKVGGAV